MTINVNNVTKRVDVSRKLTWVELDANFQELKNVITDLSALIVSVGNKVSADVYAAKIESIENRLGAIENSIVNGFDLVLKSPNNTKYLLTVSNSGVLSAIAL